VPASKPALDQFTRILLAHVAGAHGIRGELLLKTYTGAPEDVAAYGPLSDQAGTKQFSLKVVRVTPKGVIARIKGVDDRNAAEALKSMALYIDRTKLPTPDEDEFYHTDLVGLTAVGIDGTDLGIIDRVLDFGAGTILEVKLTGQSKTELVPFTKACVPTVDLSGGRVTVIIPETVLGEDEPTPGTEPPRSPKPRGGAHRSRRDNL
jgi:16S rRNA processing protein RimM